MQHSAVSSVGFLWGSRRDPHLRDFCGAAQAPAANRLAGLQFSRYATYGNGPVSAARTWRAPASTPSTTLGCRLDSRQASYVVTPTETVARQLAQAVRLGGRPVPIPLGIDHWVEGATENSDIL
jgi:hypothetical protein